MATPTTNKSITKPAYNEYASDPTGWSAPINTNWDVIDAAFGGFVIKNPTGLSGTQALVLADYQKLIIVIGTSLTGVATLTANITYTIPAGVGGSWIIYNNTTGAFTITFALASGGGTSVVIPQGLRTLVFSDGTNVNFISALPYNNSITTAMLQDDSVTTAKINTGAVTYAKVETASIATAANFQANAASKLLDANGVWSSGAITALTDASTIAVNMSSGFNFSVTLGGNRVLGNPTNTKVGQSGVIVVTNPSTYTLTYDTAYKFANGFDPVVTTSGTTILSYFVVSSSFVVVVALLGVA